MPTVKDPLLERAFYWSLFAGFLAIEAIVLVSVARLLLGSNPLPTPYPPEMKALNAALAAAQGEFPPIRKDKTAKAGAY